LAEQGKVEGFFANAKNADMLSGLVRDIHNAMMEYQVCGQNELIALMPNSCLASILDFTTTRYL